MPGYNFHAFLGFRTFPKLLFSNTIKLCPKPPVSVDPTGTMTRSPNRLHSLQTQAVSLKVPRPPAVLTNWPQICGFPWPFQVQQLAILKSQDQPNEETQRANLRGVQTQSFCALALWGQDSSPFPHIGVFTHREAPLTSGPEFLLGFHYLGTINQTFGQVIQLNFQPPSLFHRRGWLKAPALVTSD